MLLGIFAVAAAASLLRSQPASTPAQTGQQIFGSTCAGCHGLDGRGGEHAPNIATSQKIQQLADSDIVRIIASGIPSAGMPAFGTSLKRDQIAAVVAYLRELGGKVASHPVAGNPENGREIFASAKCSDCHMMNGRGGFIGTDLSSYGANHSAAQIRNAIVDPAKNAESSHRPVLVIARDGRKYSGIVRNEDNFSLQLQSMDGTFHFFDKSNIARVDRQAKPLMPDDYGSTLSASNLDDLVSYLIANAKNQPVRPDPDDDF
jgi:putative heme-binding domain-containing protein